MLRAAAEAVHAAITPRLGAICVAEREHRHDRRRHLPPASARHVRRDGCRRRDARAAPALLIRTQTRKVAVGRRLIRGRRHELAQARAEVLRREGRQDDVIGDAQQRRHGDGVLLRHKQQRAHTGMARLDLIQQRQTS